MSADPSAFSLIEHGGRATDSLGLAACYGIRLPAVNSPDVSIVIPVFNQLAATLDCLRSLSRNPQKTSFEVILVDDSSDLAVFRAFEEIPHLRVLRNFKNQGFVHSSNRGARHARGRYVLMLNNDTEVTDDWLDALLRVFELRPDAGLVGAKLVYPDGTLQEAGCIIWNDGTGWNYGKGDDPSLPWYNYVRETDYCSGACILLPKALWETLGGFDLTFAPAYYEDTDLAFRVREAGLKVYYQPHARVIHHEGKSNGRDTATGVKRHQVENHRRFLARWQETLKSQQPSGQAILRARERSSSRKTILFVDHYLPHFDQDAGSRNIYSYLRLFLEDGFSVKFVGVNFYPHEPYQTHLQELGVEVLTGEYMRDHWRDWLRDNGAQLDYVFFSRAFSCEAWVEPVRSCTKAKVLFYGHDLLSRTLTRAFEDYGDPRNLEQAREWREKEDYIIQGSDATFYPSPLEVEELKGRFPHKEIQAVPLYVFSERDRSRDRGAAARQDLLFVGSFGHPPNVDAIEWMLSEVMPQLRRRIPELRLQVVGKNPPEKLLSLGDGAAVFHGYVSDERLRSLCAECRLSVAPLRVGGGIKGKILEAFYLGIPVATTRLGIEGIPATAEECLVVDKLEDYAEEIAKLYTQPARLDAMAEKAYEKVLRICSREAVRRAFSVAVPEFAAEPPIAPQAPSPSASEHPARTQEAPRVGLMAPATINACFRALLGRPAQEHELRFYRSAPETNGSLEALVRALVGCEEFRSRAAGSQEFVPGGHFYSVVPSDEDVRKALDGIGELQHRTSIPGIECDTDLWFRHLESIRLHHVSAPFPHSRSPGFRYYYDNPAYSYGDALSLYTKILDLRPARVVEVGSGYSSALLLDTVERELAGSTAITFIEPYPELLKSLMMPGDEERCRVLGTGVQAVDLAVFDALREGDILFIDSTHVAKLGSDVNFLFFEVLPRLAPGVRIHVHDIFWPFEYPARWIEERRAWNEAYLLRALLSGSKRYKIEYFSSYMNLFHEDWIREHVPQIAQNPGGHLWMKVQP